MTDQFLSNHIQNAIMRADEILTHENIGPNTRDHLVQLQCILNRQLVILEERHAEDEDYRIERMRDAMAYSREIEAEYKGGVL